MNAFVVFLLHALILAPFVAPGAVLAFYIIDHRRVTQRRREFPPWERQASRFGNFAGIPVGNDPSRLARRAI